MKVVWTSPATAQLRLAYDYIFKEDPHAAQICLESILQAVEHLPQFPAMGRQGRIADTRELIVTGTPYLIAYRLRQQSIRILAVVHGARRWPDDLGG